MQREDREQRFLPRTTDRDGRSAVDPHFQWPKEPQFQNGPHAAKLPPRAGASKGWRWVITKW